MAPGHCNAQSQDAGDLELDIFPRGRIQGQMTQYPKMTLSFVQTFKTLVLQETLGREAAGAQVTSCP